MGKVKQDKGQCHFCCLTSVLSLGSKSDDRSLVEAFLPGAISLALQKETALGSWLSSLWLSKSAKHTRSHTASLKGPKVHENATQNTGTYVMLSFFFFFLSSLHPWHVDVPRSGTELVPQQRLEPLSSCLILSPLHHKGTPTRSISERRSKEAEVWEGNSL